MASGSVMAYLLQRLLTEAAARQPQRPGGCRRRAPCSATRSWTG